MVALSLLRRPTWEKSHDSRLDVVLCGTPLLDELLSPFNSLTIPPLFVFDPGAEGLIALKDATEAGGLDGGQARPEWPEKKEDSKGEEGPKDYEGGTGRHETRGKKYWLW